MTVRHYASRTTDAVKASSSAKSALKLARPDAEREVGGVHAPAVRQQKPATLDILPPW